MKTTLMTSTVSYIPCSKCCYIGAMRKALAIGRTLYVEQEKLLQSAMSDDGVYHTVDLEPTLIQIAGIDHALVSKLLKIHFMYHPTILPVRIFSDLNVIVEYLRITFQYPAKREKQIFKLFTKSVRRKRTIRISSLVNKYCYQNLV